MARKTERIELDSLRIATCVCVDMIPTKFVKKKEEGRFDQTGWKVCAVIYSTKKNSAERVLRPFYVSVLTRRALLFALLSMNSRVEHWHRHGVDGTRKASFKVDWSSPMTMFDQQVSVFFFSFEATREKKKKYWNENEGGRCKSVGVYRQSRDKHALPGIYGLDAINCPAW